MHFTDSFLNLESQLYSLVFCQFNDWNANFLFFDSVGIVLYWHHRSDFVIFTFNWIKYGFDVQRSDLKKFIRGVFSFKFKICLASLAILNSFLSTHARPRIFEVINHITYERNKSDSLAKKLIVKYWSVFGYGNEMSCKGGYLGDDDSPQRVGETDIASS